MKYKMKYTFLTALVVLVVSCEKIDTNPGEQRPDAGITGESPVTGLIMTAYRSAGSFLDQYEYLELIGHTDLDASIYRYLTITVFSSHLEEKTYSIPGFTSEQVYRNPAGYITCYVAEGNATTVTDCYYSQYMKDASGYITLKYISSEVVSGFYDITVVNNQDTSNKLHLQGDFEARLAASEE